MQSDERTAGVLAALRGPREVFDGALTSAIEELHAFLDEAGAPLSDHVAHETARLGPFAADRIDVDRFSALFGRASAIGPAGIDRIRRVHDLLVGYRSQGDNLYQVRMERGSDLRDTVRDALAARGRIFNAARHVELIRAGGEINDPDDALCFTRWRRSERMLAPPLIVTVEGSDLVADGLAEYLDGAVRIVLLVNGAAPAAPLVRLIAPHTFVLQTTDPAAVAQLGAAAGPGIAAVLPEGSACFSHDPSRGARLSQRLQVSSLPAPATQPIGRYSVRRQHEDEAWLSELAQFADVLRVQPQVGTESEPDPADQLAGWLLRTAQIQTTGTP